MLAATANGAFDQAKVTALANQQAQLMAQMTVQKESMQHQIYTQVLTPEQRTTADQMRQKQMARIDEHLQKLSQPATENAGRSKVTIPSRRYEAGPARACPFCLLLSASSLLPALPAFGLRSRNRNGIIATNMIARNRNVSLYESIAACRCTIPQIAR